MKNDEKQIKLQKLKPVVFFGSNVSAKHRQNTYQQMLLAKALAVTQNPEELKKMTGIRTVAEVYRTLDKMMIRREYHDSLIRAGVDPDFIARGIRDIAIKGEKDADRLNALKALMKSLGLDAYKENGLPGGGGWEDVLLEKENTRKQNGDVIEVEEYEVNVPELPESVKRTHDIEAETLRGLYD